MRHWSLPSGKWFLRSGEFVYDQFILFLCATWLGQREKGGEIGFASSVARLLANWPPILVEPENWQSSAILVQLVIRVPQGVGYFR